MASITLLEWIQGSRPDVKWLKGPTQDGTFIWDDQLINGSEIQDLIDSYDPDNQLTAEQQKQKQREEDFLRYKKRARSKDDMLAELAAGNMERVRSGIWTVPQLMALTQDSELKQLLDDINTLSYEIAFSRVDSLSNPILTVEIKNSWKQLLSDNFYL